jgi:hypothetical protein
MSAVLAALDATLSTHRRWALLVVGVEQRVFLARRPSSGVAPAAMTAAGGLDRLESQL